MAAEMKKDPLEAARAHLASLPSHLAARYSAQLIKHLADELERVLAENGKIRALCAIPAGMEVP